MRANMLAFAVGICCLQLQAHLPASEFILSLLGSAALLIFLLGRSRRTSAQALVLLACAAFGFGWAAWLAQQRLAEQLPEAWEGHDVEVRGVVATLPQNFEHGQRFEFVVEAIDAPAGLPAKPLAELPQRIMLSWYRGLHDDDLYEAQTIHPGERWHLTVRLKRPHGNANPHAFDYEAWLLERNIRATGYVRSRSGSEAQRLDAFVWRPEYVVEWLRDAVCQRFMTTLPDAPYVGVLIALTVGEQRVIPSAQWKIFNRTGITHLVSISGLHVTMVAALFAALVGWLWRRSERLSLYLPAQKAAVVAGWLAAFAYALLAGFAVPAQRTLYMLSVVALALWSGRNLGASRTLLLALLLVLILDPWAVLSAGFWLSFGAVALLFFVGTARLGETVKDTGWRKMLAQWGTTQWAVTVGSLPLLLLLFQQFSLVSPLANALAIPLVSFVITPLALLFAVLPWPPLLVFDHWLMSCLMLLLEWLADWPIWQQSAPPLWAALLAGLGVVWLLLPRGFPARWLVACCLMLPAFFWPAPRPANGEAWVEVLDVGQGLAVLVRTAEHALLYDTGPLYSAESDAGQRIVVPYLRATGVERLDALVVSHRDKDHSGGVRAVQDAVPIARTLSSVDGLGERCAAGQAWEWDGVRFTMLHPTAADYEQQTRKTNNMSCVLRVERSKGAGSMLLTADIEARDEQALLARSPALLRSDAMLAPHHGSRTSSTAEFIAAVDAREVIFPVGYRNRFNHPRPDVVERYAGRRLWRTDSDGALRVVLGDGADVAADVMAYRREQRRYWYGQ